MQEMNLQRLPLSLNIYPLMAIIEAATGFCETPKNTSFTEHHWATASACAWNRLIQNPVKHLTRILLRKKSTAFRSLPFS